MPFDGQPTLTGTLVAVRPLRAADFDALFENTKAAPWAEWVGPDASFPVTGRSRKSQLTSVPACQRAVKKAVVESLLASHRTSELPESGPAYRIEIALLEDQLQTRTRLI